MPSVGTFDWLRLAPNTIICNSALSACGASGKWQIALHVLRGMSDANAQPDQISCNAALNACRTAGDWVAVKELKLSYHNGGTLLFTIYIYIYIYYSSSSSFYYGNLIKFPNSNPGEWLPALSLLQEMPRMRVAPDEITYNCVISSCEKTANWRVALDSGFFLNTTLRFYVNLGPV